MTEEYITQVSKEIEGRLTKKLSQDFSRTESRILFALSKLDEALLIPQVQTCSLAVPGTSRQNHSKIRERTGDGAVNDPIPNSSSLPVASNYFGEIISFETIQAFSSRFFFEILSVQSRWLTKKIILI